MSWSTPPTFTTGEIPTAAKFNTMANDLRYLKGMDGDIELSDDLLLGAFSVQFGSGTRYRIRDGGSGSFLELFDNSGGGRCGLWSGTINSGSAATIIPDGTGDITAGVLFNVMVRNTTDGNFTDSSAWEGELAPGASGDVYTKDAGANRVSLSVSAGGALTIQRAAGTKTYSVCGWFTWV